MTEPRDVGPLYGGDRMIFDSDRRLVVELLSAARADRRLSEVDYAARLARVHSARTFDDLVPLTRDLMT